MSQINYNQLDQPKADLLAQSLSNKYCVSENAVRAFFAHANFFELHSDVNRNLENPTVMTDADRELREKIYSYASTYKINTGVIGDIREHRVSASGNDEVYSVSTRPLDKLASDLLSRLKKVSPVIIDDSAIIVDAENIAMELDKRTYLDISSVIEINDDFGELILRADVKGDLTGNTYMTENILLLRTVRSEEDDDYKFVHDSLEMLGDYAEYLVIARENEIPRPKKPKRTDSDPKLEKEKDISDFPIK